MPDVALLEAIRKAVAAKRSEAAERNAVATTLAKHGWIGQPEIRQSRSADGRTVRIYLWLGTPAGDVVLTTGPDAEGAVATLADLENEANAFGFFIEVADPRGKAAADTRAAVDRIAKRQGQRVMRHEAPTPTRGAAARGRMQPADEYAPPSAGERWGRPALAPAPEETVAVDVGDGQEVVEPVEEAEDVEIIAEPVLEPYDRRKALQEANAGKKWAELLKVNFGGTEQVVSGSKIEDGTIKQFVYGYDSSRGAKNWMAVATPDKRAPGGINRTWLPRISGNAGYYDASGVNPGDFIEIGSDIVNSRGKRTNYRAFVRVLEIGPDYWIVREAAGPIKQTNARSVEDELTDLDAALTHVDAETPDAPVEPTPPVAEVILPAWYDVALPPSPSYGPTPRVRYGQEEGASYESIGGARSRADRATIKEVNAAIDIGEWNEAERHAARLQSEAERAGWEAKIRELRAKAARPKGIAAPHASTGKLFNTRRSAEIELKKVAHASPEIDWRVQEIRVAGETQYEVVGDPKAHQAPAEVAEVSDAAMMAELATLLRSALGKKPKKNSRRRYA